MFTNLMFQLPNWYDLLTMSALTLYFVQVMIASIVIGTMGLQELVYRLVSRFLTLKARLRVQKLELGL